MEAGNKDGEYNFPDILRDMTAINLEICTQIVSEILDRFKGYTFTGTSLTVLTV